jgi:hypothetical protein
MDDWFDALAARPALPADAVRELRDRGFVVLPGLVPAARLERLTDAYKAAVSAAADPDVRVGSTSTRIGDLVNRGAAFDELYVLPPLLDACCRVIGRPFRLSSLLARTLRAHVPAQELHVDVARDSADWPLLGFLLMIDAFQPGNGATRFVPGSQRWPGGPESAVDGPRDDPPGTELACGPAGSLIVFDGSTWHGHSANASDALRRSIQGAFIPRDGRAATDFGARMPPDTRARLGPLAHHVLGLVGADAAAADE